MSKEDSNPYRAGAGHSPPYLAGRKDQIQQFSKFLDQRPVTKNVILTGLRGVGKTVLMDGKYKPLAIGKGWSWVGSDFSESAFLSEDRLCTRLITDLAVLSSGLTIRQPSSRMGLVVSEDEDQPLDFGFLMRVFEQTPGLSTDKLKAVLSLVWKVAESVGIEGIVFAYDEAQVVCDREQKDEYPLAVLLETFQSLQRSGARLLLLLTGLPTLFPRLVESRTYAERMFAMQEIGRLTPEASREAIEVPTEHSIWKFTAEGVKKIIHAADGYPYFIQFICRQTFDYLRSNPGHSYIPIEPITRQLDADFFAGRWDTLTDRQRDFLYCIACIETSDSEFTIAEISESSKECKGIKSFSPNDVSQMIPRLIDRGLIYKNRLGKYSFAVPLFRDFIKRAVENRRSSV